MNLSSSSDQPLYNQNTVCDGKEGWYVGGVAAVSDTSMTLNDTLRVPLFPNMTAPRATPTTDYAQMVRRAGDWEICASTLPLIPRV